MKFQFHVLSYDDGWQLVTDILHLILCCLYIHSDRFFDIYFHELKMFKQIFVSKVYRLVFWKNSSLGTTQNYVSQEWEQI